MKKILFLLLFTGCITINNCPEPQLVTIYDTIYIYEDFKWYDYEPFIPFDEYWNDTIYDTIYNIDDLLYDSLWFRYDSLIIDTTWIK